MIFIKKLFQRLIDHSIRSFIFSQSFQRFIIFFTDAGNDFYRHFFSPFYYVLFIVRSFNEFHLLQFLFGLSIFFKRFDIFCVLAQNKQYFTFPYFCIFHNFMKIIKNVSLKSVDKYKFTYYNENKISTQHNRVLTIKR